MWMLIFAPIGVCHDVSCILMSFFLNNFAYLLSLSLKYILLITILTTISIRIIHYFYSSGLCACGKFNRSWSWHNIYTFRCYYHIIKRISCLRYPSNIRSFRFNFNYSPTFRWLVGERREDYSSFRFPDYCNRFLNKLIVSKA